ncbi:MAG: hypothetical protein DLM67_17775 [Candidatus Nephthysia bennettiae]|uniref:Lipopolysaccharide biosynthesis protein n=1 Tax=Candidatus Nephthysia bennettiae TaxID=3127016 RepID=A0A934KAM8_9BACT|nr:hypothetical protein [Candidatus Dormibacteraeota bacterium]MBJ7610842.1 hypothetical protein [Candidatus Dormibacteraeota bacterium]PZR90363.1 MAG: hypothetical protein DLM67_17775 [Candidatus Dormibacteraeota bacterium]
MLRYLETFYRHRLLLMAPVALVLLLTGGWVLVQPPSYDSTVRLWVQRQTLVPNPDDNPYLTPAQQQSAVLTELLNTKYFCMKVGNRSPLAESLATSSGQSQGPLQRLLGGSGGTQLSGRALDDAVYQAVSHQTVVQPAGPEVVMISYRGSSPELSAVVGQAVADQFIEETLASQRVQAEAAQQFYDSQVKQTQAEGASIQTQIDSYLTGHPDQRGSSAPADATLSQLRKNQDAAQQRQNDLQAKLDQTKVSLAGLSQPSVSGMRILDKAEVPTRSSSMRSVALQGAAVGLSLALLILIGGILLLTLIDSTLRRPEEIERVLDLKPVGTVPRLT